MALSAHRAHQPLSTRGIGVGGEVSNAWGHDRALCDDRGVRCLDEVDLNDYWGPGDRTRGMEAPEEVEDSNSGHEVSAVFRHLLRLAAIRSEAIGTQSVKKAHNAPGAAEGEAVPAVKKGKKHIKDTARKEVQQLLVFLEFVIGPAHSDEDRLQAQFHALFHQNFASSHSVLDPLDVQLMVEALQAYLDACKAVSSWQKKLGSYLLLHLQENRDDPDNSLIGLPVHKGILKGCYEEVGGLMHLSEALNSKRSSSRRCIARGALAVAFPPSSDEVESVVKVEGSSKRKRRTRKTSANTQDTSRDTLVAEAAPKAKKKSHKLKGSWIPTAMLNPSKKSGSSDSKLQVKSHKRSKSGNIQKEDIEIVRTPAPPMEDASGGDGEDAVEGNSCSRPQSPAPMLESQQVDHSSSGSLDTEEAVGSMGRVAEEGTSTEAIEPTSHSDVVVSIPVEENTPAIAVQKNPVFVRVLRAQEGRVTVAMCSAWPQESVELPANRVLPLHSDLQKMLGNPRGMSQLVDNPLEEWYAESSSSLKMRMESLMEERGVDVQRMKHAAKQQEGDIKTLSFLLHCKDILERIVKEPPNDLLQELNAHRKQEVLQLVSSGAPCFLPTREGLVQYLQEVDYAQEAMRTVTANLQNVDTALEQVALEKVRLLNGTRKDELSRWWLTQISTMCTEFLAKLGFVEEAVPENYIETPPSDIKAVRANLQLVKEVLDRKEDVHGTQGLVSEVKQLVYGRIDSFLEDTILALAAELGHLTDEPFSSEKARLCLEEMKDSLDEEHHQRIENNIKDVEYLCRMKQLEEEEQGGQLRLGDVVPVSGLVMSAFHRRENVLKTVIELWGSREPEEDTVGRSLSATSRQSAIEAMEACNDAFEDIGADFVMTKRESASGDKDTLPVYMNALYLPVPPTLTPIIATSVSPPEERTCATVDDKAVSDDGPLERESDAEVTDASAISEGESKQEPSDCRDHSTETPAIVVLEEEGESKDEEPSEVEKSEGRDEEDMGRDEETPSEALPREGAHETGAPEDSTEACLLAVELDEPCDEDVVGVFSPTLHDDSGSEPMLTVESSGSTRGDASEKTNGSDNPLPGESEMCTDADHSQDTAMGDEEPSVDCTGEESPPKGLVLNSEEDGDVEPVLGQEVEGIFALDEADRALAAAEAAVLAAGSKEEAEAAIAALEQAVAAAEMAVRHRKSAPTLGVEGDCGEEGVNGVTMNDTAHDESEDAADLTCSNESNDTLVAVSKDVLSFADSVLCGSPLREASPVLELPIEPTDSTTAVTPMSPENSGPEEVPPDSPGDEGTTATPVDSSELAKIEAELLECELLELELEEAALAAELAQLSGGDAAK